MSDADWDAWACKEYDRLNAIACSPLTEGETVVSLKWTAMHQNWFNAKQTEWRFDAVVAITELQNERMRRDNS